MSDENAGGRNVAPVPKVFYSTPWQTGNIGAGINEFVSLLPDDAWVCIRDGDSMFLTSTWGKQIEAIISANDDYSVIGCMTNRLRAPYQLHGGVLSDDPDIGRHIAIAHEREAAYGASVLPVDGPVAGLCMIFPKRIWNRVKFQERSIFFDKEFCADVRKLGGRVGVAQGLYLFHAYRWGRPDPCNYKGHLA